MKTNLKFKVPKVIVFLLVLITIIFAGCTEAGEIACTADAMRCPDGTFVGRSGPNCEFDCSDHQVSQEEANLQGFGGLKKLESEQELKEFLLNTDQMNLGSSFDDFGSRTAQVDMEVAMDSVNSPSANKGAGDGSSSESANVYSETNVQVEGVDEADIVKNDGKYIYGLNNNKLYIANAYPPESAELVYEGDIDGSGQEIFVNNDRLVVFSNTREQTISISKYDYMPYPSYDYVTKVSIYDISDRSNPRVVENYTITGSYYDSRMIGDKVYVISNEGVYYYDYTLPDFPVVRSSSMEFTSPIYYPDVIDSNYNFHTVASFDVNSDEPFITSNTYMLGQSNTLFVSENNIYIAYRDYSYYRYPYQKGFDSEMFFEAVYPNLPNDIRSQIDELGNNVVWDEIALILENMYEKMIDEDLTKDAEDMIEKIDEAVYEYQLKLEEERSKTIIHKIRIEDGDIEYQAEGQVKGYLLNQFSMDEYDGNLRVATTFNSWVNRNSITYNNVYVLDEDMKQIGEIEKIAPDERIYSTRFIGDKLYMVTFKQTDPLFVIGLSDPENPEILGELKIPGFSNYLHPYDENHIIGIGKETEETQWGFTTKGVKVSLFDVSDVENPIEVDTFVIGKSGSYSLAEIEHKAVLFDKEKEILVIPVYEVGDYDYDDRDYYRENVFNGAIVLNINEQGFELRGRVSHGSDDSYYYWSSPNRIMRSLFMDDYLYTISEEMIKVNDLNSLDEISMIGLPQDEFDYDDYPIYYDIVY